MEISILINHSETLDISWVVNETVEFIFKKTASKIEPQNALLRET
jgi:hypothetical protein